MVKPAPLVITWPYALVFWVIFIWAMIPERRLVNQSKKGVDPSLKFLLIANQLGMFFAFLIAFTAWHGRIPGQWPFWTGTAILVAASLLRRHCFRMLGQFFTGHVQVTDDQVVVNRGAYRFVRHPSYTAGLLLFAGIGLALGNWWSVVSALAGAIVGYGYRIRVEERALLEKLGPKYAEYAAGRKRLIPFVI